MNPKQHRIPFFILIFLFTATFVAARNSAATPLRVAILPFQINAPSELSHLKQGIADMLASRLTWEDKVVVFRVDDPAKETQKGPISEKAAREMGAALQANLVLFGSLTALGNSISIDIKLVDLSGEKPVRTFFVQSLSLDEVIPKIDLLASDINEEVFGRTLAKKEPAHQPAPQQPKDDSRTHPEKLVQGGFQDSGGAGQSEIFLPGPEASSRANFWKSSNFGYLINGITLGDVNGDKKPETVVVTPSEVRIFSMEANRFKEIAKIDMGRFIHIVGVDSADINGNGYAEIFVSATNTQKNAAQSFILEFNGTQYVPILENSPWFYRVVDQQTGKPILLGQKISLGDPFSGDIVELTWKEKKLSRDRTVWDKAGLNLMGFSLGDVQNNGQPLYLAYDSYDHIRLLGSSGKALWEGSDKLGGSTLYFTLSQVDPGVENIQYLPMRLVVQDINNDGKADVIVAKNHEMAGRLLDRFRVYTKSQFQFLSWDGIGLSLVQETRAISGFVRDFFIGDFDADGKDELVAAIVIKEGSMAFTEPKSTIIAYEMNDMPKR